MCCELKTEKKQQLKFKQNSLKFAFLPTESSLSTVKATSGRKRERLVKGKSQSEKKKTPSVCPSVCLSQFCFVEERRRGRKALLHMLLGLFLCHISFSQEVFPHPTSKILHFSIQQRINKESDRRSVIIIIEIIIICIFPPHEVEFLSCSPFVLELCTSNERI